VHEFVVEGTLPYNRITLQKPNYSMLSAVRFKEILLNKKVRIEIVDAILVVGAVVILWMIALYYNVFWIELQDFFGPKRVGSVIEMSETRSITDAGVQQFGWTQQVHNSPSIEETLDSIEWNSEKQKIFEYSLDSYLHGTIAQYDLPFSMVPPGRFISIPSLDIQAPIETVPFATPDQIKNGDFDEQLKKWIVQYPFTGKPWIAWNTLLFWHSSVDSLQAPDNDFGFIFRKLPEIEAGALIQVVWDGEMHEYEVEKKMIKWPKDVPAEVNKKVDHDVLTLMACYPILSDAQRYLVTAVPKWMKKEEKTVVTTNNANENKS